MKLEGGCYCGAVRYTAEGAPVMKAQCHCRECQYMTGGSPNMFIAMPIEGFALTQGEPKSFTRSDIERPVTQAFCPTCGTHLTTRAPGFPAVIVKVGTLDDPAQFGGPDLAIYTLDKQLFHQIPDGLPAFERLPGRA
ncbi:MAG: glutathione-dependent formaldehyde-activating enzyme [Caulobacteraceae bacterium]|nr:glutathione-dependent formaldehyde-activating enzyme [Caulobacteraceae bacterium]